MRRPPPAPGRSRPRTRSSRPRSRPGSTTTSPRPGSTPSSGTTRRPCGGRARRSTWRDWWERLGESGWFFSTWPTEYGGLGLDSDRAAVVNNTLRRFKVPRTDNPLGINVSQALLRWGTDAQRQRFLPGIAHQREIWVQLFSEPGAGSDLAGLSTRAVRDGDQWVINGQKVWSSWAHTSQWGLLLARTDPDVPKHQGLSVFLLDMSTPGITVRPLRQMTGEAFFNEVFFDDVTCPDERRLGELGGGLADGQHPADLRAGRRRGGRLGGAEHARGPDTRRPRAPLHADQRPGGPPAPGRGSTRGRRSPSGRGCASRPNAGPGARPVRRRRS